jgi:hypothetical protein
VSNDYTTLNPGANGDAMDEEGVTYTAAPTLRKRSRVVIGGNANDGADVVLPANAEPSVGDTRHALPVRQVGRAPVRIYDGSGNPADPLNAEPAVTASNYGVPVRQIGKAPTRLYDGSNVALDVADGAAIPGGTRGLLLMGVDGGGSARRVKTTTSGGVYNVISSADGAADMKVDAGKAAYFAQVPPRDSATYGQSNASAVATSASANTRVSVAFLWHPSGVSKRYEILKVTISAYGGTGSVAYSVRGDFITATSLSTNRTPQRHDGDDPPSSSVFVVGAGTAPTRSGAEWLVCTSMPGTNIFNYVLFDASAPGVKPIVLRANTAEGFEVLSLTGGTAPNPAANVTATILWREV